MKYPKYLSHENCKGHIFWHHRDSHYFLVSITNSKSYIWSYSPKNPFAAPYTLKDAINAKPELTNQYPALRQFLKDLVKDDLNV